MQNFHNKAALLVMDMENGIVSRIAKDEHLFIFQKAIKAARQHSIPVIFVRVAFSQGYPEISPLNKSFAVIPGSIGMTVSDPATQIHQSLQPEPEESVVTKFRVSAFAGSNLEVILRSQQINTLILSGISTSGVVLSTLREAADKDYVLTVLADACLDPDPEVHRILIEKVFPRQASVLTVDAWLDTLN